PWLKPFVWWTLAITWGAPLAVGAIAIVCMMVVWPGVEMSKNLFQDLDMTGGPKGARRLTLIWCVGAGALLSLVLGTAVALIAFGVVSEVKVWFLAGCWLVLMIPWISVGLAGRWLFHRTSDRATPSPSARGKESIAMKLTKEQQDLLILIGKPDDGSRP